MFVRYYGLYHCQLSVNHAHCSAGSVQVVTLYLCICLQSMHVAISWQAISPHITIIRMEWSHMANLSLTMDWVGEQYIYIGLSPVGVLSGKVGTGMCSPARVLFRPWAVAKLTVPVGQSKNISSTLPHFPKYFVYNSSICLDYFLNLVLQVPPRKVLATPLFRPLRFTNNRPTNQSVYFIKIMHQIV